MSTALLMGPLLVMPTAGSPSTPALIAREEAIRDEAQMAAGYFTVASFRGRKGLEDRRQARLPAIGEAALATGSTMYGLTGNPKLTCREEDSTRADRTRHRSD